MLVSRPGMSPRNACFLSFRHGRHELTQQFVRQLYEALASEIEPHVGSGRVFLDEQRLRGGDYIEAGVPKFRAEFGGYHLEVTKLGGDWLARVYDPSDYRLRFSSKSGDLEKAKVLAESFAREQLSDNLLNPDPPSENAAWHPFHSPI